MTCKDCVHYEICSPNSQAYGHKLKLCTKFKNKADFVEVKHGRWEKRTFIIFDSEKVGYRCSECNTTWDTQTNFCEYCGADMRKEGCEQCLNTLSVDS